LPDVEAMVKDQLKKALSPPEAGGVPAKPRDLIKGILPKRK